MTTPIYHDIARARSAAPITRDWALMLYQTSGTDDPITKDVGDVLDLIAAADIGNPIVALAYAPATRVLTFTHRDASQGTITLAAGGGISAVNLAVNRSASEVTITNDAGSNAQIPAADANNAGVMSRDQFSHLDSYPTLQDASARVGRIPKIIAGGTIDWQDDERGTGGGANLAASGGATGRDTLTAGSQGSDTTAARGGHTHQAVAPAVAGSPGTDGLMRGADKQKLDGIADGAEVNVQADWDATSGDAFIQNKPSIPEPATATPVQSGASGAVGSSLLYARQDHRHQGDGGGGGTATLNYVQLLDWTPAAPVVAQTAGGNDMGFTEMPAAAAFTATPNADDFILIQFSISNSATKTADDTEPHSISEGMKGSEWNDLATTANGAAIGATIGFTTAAFQAHAGNASTWARGVIGKGVNNRIGFTFTNQVDAYITRVIVHSWGGASAAPPAPPAHQRYGRYAPAAATLTSAYVRAGTGSTTEDLTLAGAPAGRGFVGFWSAQRLTFISSQSFGLEGTPPPNILNRFTETQADSGYLYVINQSIAQGAINSAWILR